MVSYAGDLFKSSEECSDIAGEPSTADRYSVFFLKPVLLRKDSLVAWNRLDDGGHLTADQFGTPAMEICSGTPYIEKNPNQANDELASLGK